MSFRSSIDLGPFSDSRFAQLLRTGFAWLRFPRDLERQFDEFHLHRIRSRVRVFFILWPAMEIYKVIDGWISGVDVISLWMIPSLLFIAGGASVLWSRWYWSAYLPGATALATALLTLTAFTIPLDYPHNVEMHALRFGVNVPLIAYVFLGLPFYRATAITFLCAIAYFVGVTQAGMATVDLISGGSSIVIAAIVATALAYTAEYSNRTYFLQECLLGEVAARDGMTGLQNRSAMDAHLERLWKQAQRTQEPIGLLLLDVDHFKGFNDALGHQAGDACLQQIAAILKGYARRPLDLAARYGGEEFAVILFQTPPDQIRAIAEAIRAAVEALGIANPAAPRKIVTLSCGVAIVTPSTGRSLHGLVQMADEALYEAKGHGRNCVRSADHDYSQLETGCFRHRSHLRVVN